MNPGKPLAVVLTAMLLFGMFFVALPRAEAVATVTLSGEFSYASQSGAFLYPCQGAFVQLWTKVSNGEVAQASGYTDEYGEVVFPNVPIGNYTFEISTTDNHAVSVCNASLSGQQAYAWRTGWNDYGASRTVFLNITSHERAAWSAYDAVRLSHEWLYDMVGWSRSMVTVSWPTEDWPHSHGDEIDIPASSNPDYMWQKDVIIHEYGHCVMYTAYGDSFPAFDVVDPHYMDTESDPSFAIVEGWAEFFARAVLGDPSGPSFTSLESTVYADGPFRNGDKGDWDGNIVEGATANVLWDILDGNDSTDRPSWANDTIGDQVNDRFSIFWNIFLGDNPSSMDEVWSLWQKKDLALATIFVHARFLKDLDMPTNPEAEIAWSDHDVGVASNDSSVSIGWVGATDNGTGVQGYSIVWSHIADELPDDTVDTISSLITMHLEPGTWYLHVRTIDNSGNAAVNATHYGPFIINVGATDQGSAGSNGVTSEMDLALQIVLLAILAGAAILLILFVSRMVRKPKEEDLLPPPPVVQYYYPPPYYYQQNYQQNYQYQYQYYPPQPPMPPAPPVPPAPGQAQSDIPVYCRNCGRLDAGGPFCPYCGYRLR